MGRCVPSWRRLRQGEGCGGGGKVRDESSTQLQSKLLVDLGIRSIIAIVIAFRLNAHPSSSQNVLLAHLRKGTRPRVAYVRREHRIDKVVESKSG
jgi:hypothetical protein